MITVATIVGARPQFIKAAAVSRAMRGKADFRELLIHTGQHYDPDMSDVFFREMDIPTPQYHLGIGSGTHGAQTGRMLQSIEDVLVIERPDWVLVYGDTNSTLAGALAASKVLIPVAHVEAGLRSWNRAMPEEVNRVVTDHISDLLFAPTKRAVCNLANEGIAGDNVLRTGDVMYDAALFYREIAAATSTVLERLELAPREYCLATVHRPANTDNPNRLSEVVRAFEMVGDSCPVVWPVHPRTRSAIQKSGLQVCRDRVKLIAPLGYLDMIWMETNAQVILTDSGGVQREAFFFQVPCITLREETEWVELIEHGFSRLCPELGYNLLSCYNDALSSAPNWNLPLYGTGTASETIVSRLASNEVER